MKPLHHTTSNTTKNTKPVWRIFYNTIIDLGRIGTFGSMAFLWVFTYFGYYLITDISLRGIVDSTESNKTYLYIAFIFYILNIIYWITDVNVNKICKKHNVAVIE